MNGFGTGLPRGAVEQADLPRPAFAILLSSGLASRQGFSILSRFAITLRRVPTLQSGRDIFVRGLGGRHGSLGDGNSSAGDCDGVLGTGANEIACEVGRVDCRRVPPGHWEGAGDLPAAVWNIGETWAALAVGNGLVERAVCDGACGAAGVRGDIPRLLFWTDCGSTA